MQENTSHTDGKIEKQMDGKIFSFDKNDMELLNTLSRNISASCGRIDKEWLSISIALYTIDHKNLYLLKDAKNISQFADRAFNIRHSQTYNYINVVKKFGDIQPDGSCSAIKKEYEKFAISKLIRLLKVPDDELCQFTPDMTVKQIETIIKPNQNSLEANDVPSAPASNLEPDMQPPEKKKTYVENELTTPKVIYEIKSAKGLDKLSDVIDDIRGKMTAPGRNKYHFKIVQEPVRQNSTRVERKRHENQSRIS